MQTLLVHTRDPAGLIGYVGIRGALAMLLFIGGAIWSALSNPVLWLVFAVSTFCLQVHAGPDAAEQFAVISGTGLLMANAMLAGLVLTSGRWRGHPRLALYGLGLMLYWVMISVAAWRALWQLFFSPFVWEKTPHGQSRQRGVLR